MSSSLSIIFMGTPEFASHSLKVLHENRIEIKAVITAPDKPAGRGQSIRVSAVKEYAVANKIQTLQPTNLKDEHFINELKELDADLFVVVAFRMLPEVVWGMPKLGTINLHGSLLPNYRGAAPINWAVINGEKETGVTTFFIEKEIDTGKIIERESTDIRESDNAGSLHDRLMEIGGKLMLKTVKSIFKGTTNPISQDELKDSKHKDAPKIFKPDCKIDWEMDAISIFNKIRGLSPYPASFTQIKNKETGKIKSLKIFDTKKTKTKSTPGDLLASDNLLFGCKDYFLEIEELQMEGKKRMKTADFRRGFDFNNWELILN